MQFNLLTIVFLLPSLITLIVLRIKKRPWEQILSVLGWRPGSPLYYLWALLFVAVSTIPLVLLALFVFPDLYHHPSRGVTLYYYARLGFSLSSVLIAFFNEFFFTALGEEVFFRGLVGGWLMRRFGFGVGNVLQAIVFLLPHLVVLFVDVRFWPLLLAPLILGWFAGWLRYKSESIFPGMIIHSLGNTLNDTLAMILGG
ncbi:MAG TPA: CPBP family intramembrane glutamic endopeptidase [Ktedonosporobacter sp.]|nr:CPBP family intramembrane glutamic endopeptidase [Ktedonosporobacter sp.]